MKNLQHKPDPTRENGKRKKSWHKWSFSLTILWWIQGFLLCMFICVCISTVLGCLPKVCPCQPRFDLKTKDALAALSIHWISWLVTVKINEWKYQADAIRGENTPELLLTRKKKLNYWVHALYMQNYPDFTSESGQTRASVDNVTGLWACNI